MQEINCFMLKIFIWFSIEYILNIVLKSHIVLISWTQYRASSRELKNTTLIITEADFPYYHKHNIHETLSLN